MKRWRIGVLLGVLALFTASPSARSAPTAATTGKPSAADAAQAYKHLAAGQKLLAAKKFTEARGELEVSFGLDPQPVALKGISDCLRGEGRIVDAYESYERTLAQPGRPLLAYQRKEVETALADLAQKTSKLTIVVNEEGAAITIDGAGVGTSPRTTPVRLEAGAHKVSVTKAGFVPFETTVTLLGGQALDVAASLSAVVQPANTIEVIVKEKTGKQVDVVIDGLVVGKTPWRGNFSKGAFHLSLADAGIASAPREVTIGEGDSVGLEVVLEAPVAVVAPEPDCRVDDDCDPRYQCKAGVCERRPKKPKYAPEGEDCSSKDCAEGLVCSENTCRKKANLPFSLRGGLSASWRVALGVGGESKWVAPVHVFGASIEASLSRWFRYHASVAYASVNGRDGVYASPLSFGVPIPLRLLPESSGVKLYVEPGIDAFRAYGAFSSDSKDGVFAFALWGRLVAVRKELFVSFVPLEIEQAFFRITGNSHTGIVYKTSGTNYVMALGVGVLL